MIVYKVVRIIKDNSTGVTALYSVVAPYQWTIIYPVGEVVKTAFPMFAFDNSFDAGQFAEQFLEFGDVVVYRAEASTVIQPPDAIPFGLTNATDEEWYWFWYDRAKWEKKYPNKNFNLPSGTVWVNGITLIEKV